MMQKRNNNNVLLVLVLSLLSLVSVSGVFLSSSFVSADGVVDEISITVPVSCTMSGTGQDSHSSEIINGIYDDDIGSTTVDIYCNDSNGFAIYATGYTGNTIGETNSNKLVGVSTNTTIETGLATSAGNPDVSNWAMKLTKTQDSGDTTGTNAFTIDSAPNVTNGANAPFTSYHIIPNEYTKVAHKDSATDMTESTGEAKFTTTYAAYISQDQPADTYSGQVIYTLVHPADEVPLQPQTTQAGKICYYPNSNNVLGEMGCQDVASSVTLYAANFSREGYGFAGWNDKFDYTGNFYGPNQTITLTTADYSTNGLSLYAVWVKSVGSLQDSTKVAELCGTGNGSLTRDPNDGTANLTTVTALTDERDGNTYAIAKLADGKCWMIENLRLADKDSNGNDIILTAQNTHNPSLPLNNSWYYKNQQGTLTTSNHLSAASDPTSTNPDTAWCQTNSSDCDDQSMVATNNTTLFTDNTASSYSATSNVYSYGNYYNWYSATAGHGKYGSSYDSRFVATGDICPAGWHLPKGGDESQESNNEFWQLIVTGINNGTNPANYDSVTYPYYTGTPEGTTASNALRTYPNNFVYSGNVVGSSVVSRNSHGSYWSASGYAKSNAYYMSLSSSDVYPGTSNGSKYNGRVVRCVSGV